MAWLFLLGAIVSEVAATLSLRVAAYGQQRWYAVVTVGYLTAFTMLVFTLDAGLGLAAAYGIWTASGVAITAVASRVLFDEPLTLVMVAGIALIGGGVLLVELGATQ